MEKLKLDLKDLKVDSFKTELEKMEQKEGTVIANQSNDHDFVCDEPTTGETCPEDVCNSL